MVKKKIAFAGQGGSEKAILAAAQRDDGNPLKYLKNSYKMPHLEVVFGRVASKA